ncbi:DUF5667 domain-containing protein [Nocardioides sp. GXQ0305]|uniref:DUF5667 domain-containing protein n=1 Tax=Nocardioides sp. GXQ0305 TaxID=3423912 RepID=UPI003D7E0E2B
MTSVFASRRRAEEFHSLVETPTGGAPRDDHLQEFLAIVESLRAVPDAEPRPEFVTSLRDELMTAADTLLVPAGDDRLTLPARNPRRDRRIAVAIGGIALVGAGTSMAVAAQSALPGEMLYPLKRAIEDAETGVASSPDAQGRTLLDSATSRLSEVEELGREGDLADQEVAVSSNFVDFGTHADQAAGIILDEYAETGDRDLVRDLRDFTGDSMATLLSLEDQVPASARDELLAAVEVVSEIDARARQACPSCGGAGVDQIPPVLLSSATSEAPVVVIPGATVEAGESGGEGRDGRRGDDGDGRTGDGSLTGSLLGSDDGSGDGSAGSGDGTTNPLDDLTDGLTGDGPTASNGGAGDTVKDTVKGVKGAVKGTKDTLDDTTQQLEDTVDELGDSLLGGN